MTEEIIIDGVNVARCCCYENGKCLWTKRYYESDVVPDCEKIKDCYYKQLKRLEQKNKELKEQAQLDGECIDKLIEARDMYRSALEEIKHILEIHKDELEECLHNDIDGMIQSKIDEVLE